MVSEKDHVAGVLASQAGPKPAHVFEHIAVTYLCGVVAESVFFACHPEPQVAHDRGHEQVVLQGTQVLHDSGTDEEDLVPGESLPFFIHGDQAIAVTVKSKSKDGAVRR